LSKTIYDRADEFLKQVGERLKRQRTFLKVSRKDLGKLFTPPFETSDIRAIEEGKEDLPLTEFFHLCTFLKTTPGKIIRALRPGSGHTKGVEHHSSKLTEDQVRHIKRMTGKVSSKALAEKYGVTRVTIHHIQAGKTWKHLESED
jgi:DNA-binding Xre family transcriptional regulator